MKFYFSATPVPSLYRDDIHLPGQIPEGAVELTPERYADIKQGLEDGKWLQANTNGEPYLRDPTTIKRTLDQVQADRQVAYRSESDHLKMEAEYDALEAGTEPDYTAWRAKVAEIKQRFPLPDQ